MARVLKLLSILIRGIKLNRSEIRRIEDLPQSLRRDIGLPANPDPPGANRSWEQFL